jgi:DNA-binding transcriptional LysR family regulator
MALRLPPLASLRLFEAAARHQSFKKAAQELNLTPSAVSHGVVTLERWLDVALFHRGAMRGVTLTSAGRQYLPYVSEALSMIAVGTQRLPGRRTERRIVISVAPTFASRWLVPNLPKFRKLHAGVAITLDTSHRQTFFPLDGVDLAIRMGRGEWPGMRSDLLMRERLVPVAAPDYLRATGRGGSLDLAKVTQLHVSSIENDWAAWVEGSGTGLEMRSGLSFDTVQLALDAAAQGLGVAIGRLPLAQEDLASGRLVMASDVIVPIETGYWLVGVAGEEPRTDIRAFRRWILEHTADHNTEQLTA